MSSQPKEEILLFFTYIREGRRSRTNPFGVYVSDDLRDRADDIIWQLRWGKDWLYVYLLLEFQSTVDHWMAVRIMTYLGLLYQDLIRTGQVGAGKHNPQTI